MPTRAQKEIFDYLGEFMKKPRQLHLHLSRRKLVALGALCLAFSPSQAWATNQSGVSVPPLPTFDQSDSVRFGTALAKYTEEVDAGWVDQYSKSKMTLYDARGDKVTRKVVQAILEGKNGDKSIVRFMSPPDIRGVAALVHEKPGGTDDSWLYLPASRRVRRISGANRTSSFQGTEFTYEDLSSLSVERYSWKFIKKGRVGSEPVYLLEARPRYRDTGYSKIVVSLHQKFFRSERLVYFDKAGRRLKTLSSADWRHVHGRFWRPRKQEMANHQTRKRTTLETTSLHMNMALYPSKKGGKRKNLSEALFTRRALESS